MMMMLCSQANNKRMLDLCLTHLQWGCKLACFSLNVWVALCNASYDVHWCTSLPFATSCVLVLRFNLLYHECVVLADQTNSATCDIWYILLNLL